jgi:Ca2+:H+ antiporter
MSIVFFVIVDDRYIKKRFPDHFFASEEFIFALSLASVIPLSYFIGTAVASISAQSSVGLGAVINATFGSIIEIILYGIALNKGKGKLTEGSIIGSLMAGVLLMPGVSMISGGLKRKEQKFNSKSAGNYCKNLFSYFIHTHISNFINLIRSDINNAYYGYHWCAYSDFVLSNICSCKYL